MKNPTPIAVPFALAATSLLHAQEYSEDLTNFFSFDELGTIGNLVFTQPIGQSLITNISWTDVVGDGSSSVGAPSGGSWGNEMRMDVNGQDIQFFPDEGPGSPGGIWGPASGSVDVSIPVDGDLRIEFYESYDDLPLEVDAVYTGGSITITYVPASDCNQNGIPDADELSIETDCDSNGTLDECELINGDCDQNGVLDPCEITPENDCDASGILDSCELEIFDCDANGVLDSCESQATEITFDTGLLDGGAVGPTYTFESDGSWNRIEVDLDFNNEDGDETFAGDLILLLTDPNGNCAQLGGFNIVLCEGNEFAFPGAWGVDESGNYAVIYQTCGANLSGSGTWSVELSHGWDGGMADQWSGTMTIGVGPGTVIDCNENGVDDADEISPATDCDTNGVLDECELESGDCNANGVLDSCEDATDCNTNGVPDECELESGDCNANGVLDSCEDLGSTETELAFDTGVLNGGESVDLSVALGGSLVSLGVQLDFNNADGDPTYAGDLLIQLTSPAGNCIEVGGFDLFNCGEAVSADFDVDWDEAASAAYAFTFQDLSLCNDTAGDWAVQLMHGWSQGLADQWSGTLTIGTADDSGPVCPADIDGSGAVDFGDLVQILSNWGGDGPEDLDGSGTVDFGDLVQVLSNFGPC